MGFFDSDDDTAEDEEDRVDANADDDSDDDESSEEADDDDGQAAYDTEIEEQDATLTKGRYRGDKRIGKWFDTKTANAKSQFEERVNHYKDRIQRYNKKRAEDEDNNNAKKPAAAQVDVLHEAPQILKLPKPIINVGWPKAGTSTIFSFFHCNGLPGQHWFCCDDQKHPGSAATKRKLMSRCMIENLINGTKVFEGCGDFDVYSEINGPRYFRQTNGMNILDDGTILSRNRSLGSNFRLFFPQHHQIDRIHHDYPNATFILNHRP
ncbi:MAG: hypothetical protein SGARI_001486, partial [Bacillariaceae sp.]